MLFNVIQRLSQDTGYDIERDRAALVQLAQLAAKEMHNTLECNRLKREVTLIVPTNKLVSLPAFVGEIKGVRQHTTDNLVDLYGIAQPRYLSYTWKYKVKNWRDVGESPVHTLPSTQGKLTFEVSDVESTPVAILISGHSEISVKTTETVTMDDISKQTVHLYGPEIYTIVCLAVRTHDITVKDDSGNEIAILYANDQYTNYKVIDVSELYQPNDTTDTNDNPSSLIDVCYKVKPTFLNDDQDLFFTNNNDYDDAWFYKAMELFCKPIQNREADTAKYAASYLVACGNDKQNEEKSIDKKVIRGRNKYHGIINRYGRRWPYVSGYPYGTNCDC